MIKSIITRLSVLAETRIGACGRCDITEFVAQGAAVHPQVAEYFKSAIPGSPLDLFDYRLCSKRELKQVNTNLMPKGSKNDCGLILIGSTPCGDLLAIEIRNAVVYVLSHELLWTPRSKSSPPMNRSRILKTAVARFANLSEFLNEWERLARAIVAEKQRFAKASRRDPNVKDDSGFTPLHYATHFGEERKVQSLLKRGANVELEDDAGETPLFHACMIGSIPIARLLISAGAEINHRSRKHRTPLMSAVSHSRLGCIKLLLRNGADVFARDEDKQRAIDQICPVHGTPQIRRTLKDAMQQQVRRARSK